METSRVPVPLHILRERQFQRFFSPPAGGWWPVNWTVCWTPGLNMCTLSTRFFCPMPPFSKDC